MVSNIFFFSLSLARAVEWLQQEYDGLLPGHVFEAEMETFFLLTTFSLFSHFSLTS